MNHKINFDYFLINVGTVVESNLEIVSSCTCPGYEVVFECAVSGGGSTTWQGTALANCDRSRIILRHSEFTKEGGYVINKMCGSSGTITGQAVSVVNDTYLSQLTITASEEVNGSTIECVGGHAPQTSRTRQLLLTTGMKIITNVVYYSFASSRSHFSIIK